MQNFSDLDSFISALQEIRRARGNISVATVVGSEECPISVDVAKSQKAARTRVYLTAVRWGDSLARTPSATPTVPAPAGDIDPALIRNSRAGLRPECVCVVSSGDSRCCHAKCPGLRVTATSATCLLFGSDLAKVPGPGADRFRNFECLGNFGG